MSATAANSQHSSPVWRLAWANWNIANSIAEMLLEVDAVKYDAIEVVETHRWNPNRRVPNPRPPNAHHPSFQTASQQVLLTPIDSFAGHQPGCDWGRFQFGSQAVILDADERASALAGYQALWLLLQDREIAADWQRCGFTCIRLRRRLTHPSGRRQLGYFNGNGVFSIDASEPIPYMSRTAAHQIGHSLFGELDEAADAYARRYSQRSQALFHDWRKATGMRYSSPQEKMRTALEILKRHAPQIYDNLKDNVVKPEPEMRDAEPKHVLVNFLFFDKQQQEEQHLQRRGVFARLPKVMPDCVGRNTMSLKPSDPFAASSPTVGQIAPPLPQQASERTPLPRSPSLSQSLLQPVALPSTTRSADRLRVEVKPVLQPRMERALVIIDDVLGLDRFAQNLNHITNEQTGPCLSANVGAYTMVSLDGSAIVKRVNLCDCTADDSAENIVFKLLHEWYHKELERLGGNTLDKKEEQACNTFARDQLSAKGYCYTFMAADGYVDGYDPARIALTGD